MEYERMLDKDHKPSEKEILEYLGGEGWRGLGRYRFVSANFRRFLAGAGLRRNQIRMVSKISKEWQVSLSQWLCLI